jgi:hypothetical protein
MADLLTGTVPPLSIGAVPLRPNSSIAIVPLTSMPHLMAKAITEARSLGDEVVAVTVNFEDENAPPNDLTKECKLWPPDVRLVTLRSRYSSFVEPILEYIDYLRAEEPERVILVLIPVIVSRRLRYRLLHNHLGLVLRTALRRRTDVVVARVWIDDHD